MMLTGRDGEAGPFKQSSWQIVEIHPEGVGPHSSLMSTSRLKGGVSCDQGHRYTPNLVEHSRLVIPQSCEARITSLLAQRPSVHCTLSSDVPPNCRLLDRILGICSSSSQNSFLLAVKKDEPTVQPQHVASFRTLCYRFVAIWIRIHRPVRRECAAGMTTPEHRPHATRHTAIVIFEICSRVFCSIV